MIETYFVYDYEWQLVDWFQDYETALSLANSCFGFVITQTELWQMEEEEEEEDVACGMSGIIYKKMRNIRAKKKRDITGYII